MDVNMNALLLSFLTSFMLGGLLRVTRYACSFTSVLLFGKSDETRCAVKIIREIKTAIYLVFCTVVMILFLYRVNRGALRWFIIFAIAAAYVVTERIADRWFVPAIEGMLLRVRHRIGGIIAILLSPFRRATCLLWRLGRKLYVKLSLPIRRKYDKIKIKIQDGKKRKRMETAFRKMLVQVRVMEKHGH